MTIAERVKKIVKDGCDIDDGKSASLEKLVYIAYFMGREEAARRVCDKASDLIKAQRQRAKACRYHGMANAIIGDADYIFDGDYSGDMTDAFGNDPSDI